MQHTFVAYVEDKPGVLTRVASLFRRLNINISSVTVGGSERPNISRMTMVCDAPPAAGHRIMASLYKLENVIQVDDVGRFSSVSRELFRARVVDLAPGSLMIEITGSESKIEGLLQVLNENEDRVMEISRTGRMVMRRGHHTSRVLEALGDVESQNGAVSLPMADELPEEEETDEFHNDSGLPHQKT
jgi:acetolactate synthase I/III small subunit